MAREGYALLSNRLNLVGSGQLLEARAQFPRPTGNDERNLEFARRKHSAPGDAHIPPAPLILAIRGG